MNFLDRDVKEMPSLSYTEYFEDLQSRECEECKTPRECKADFFLDNNKVSELPQVYLLCSCPEGLWLPLVQDRLPDPKVQNRPRDPKGVIVTHDDLNKGVLWSLCNPNLSKYADNNKVLFAKCQKKEEDFFLRSHIKANILESLSQDYCKLCHETIDLNLKLGLLNAFLSHRLGDHHVSARSGLKNSTCDLVQYSGSIFWADYVSTYFDSCIVRIHRLMHKPSPKSRKRNPINSYKTYSDRYLKHYPEKEDKSEICEIDPRLSKIRDQYVAHNDRRFSPEVSSKDLEILCDSYTKVLKAINSLNKMQGLKIVFCYDPSKTRIARPILGIIDNELERYEREVQVDVEQVFELTGTSYADLNITLMNQPIRDEHEHESINTVQLITKNQRHQLIGSIEMNCLATQDPTLIEVLYDYEQRCWHLTERGEAQLRGANT